MESRFDAFDGALTGQDKRVALWANLAKLHASNDLDQLGRNFTSAVGELGFDLVFYRHFSWRYRRVEQGRSHRYTASGNELIQGFLSTENFEENPEIASGLATGRPFQILGSGSAPDASMLWFQDPASLDAAGAPEVLAIPVFTRPGDFALFGLASAGNSDSLDKELPDRPWAICNAYHNSYNRLVLQDDNAHLSSREAAVIELIATGQSNAEIAIALEVTIR